MSEETIRLFKKWMWGEEETVKEFSREEVEKMADGLMEVAVSSWEKSTEEAQLDLARHVLLRVQKAREEEQVRTAFEAEQRHMRHVAYLEVSEKLSKANARIGVLEGALGGVIKWVESCGHNPDCTKDPEVDEEFLCDCGYYTALRNLREALKESGK